MMSGERAFTHKHPKCFFPMNRGGKYDDDGEEFENRKKIVTDNCYDFALKLHNFVVITFHSFPSIEGECSNSMHTAQSVKGGGGGGK